MASDSWAGCCTDGVGAVEDLKFEYYSRRSIVARFGVHISDVAVSMMKWSTWLLILLGTVIVFVAGWSMVWV